MNSLAARLIFSDTRQPTGARGVLTIAVVAVLGAGASLAARQSGAPFAPRDLANLSLGGGSRVSLAWLPASQGPAATFFDLQAGSAPGASDLGVMRLPGTQNLFAVDAPAGVYYVRVVAINAAGASAPSNEVVVTVTAGGCVAPNPPLLTALSDATSVTMTLIPALTGGAPTSYVLDAGSSVGASNLGSFPLPVTTVYTASAPPGVYFLRLRAVNACGTSQSSGEIAVAVGGAAAPLFLGAGQYVGMIFDSAHPPADGVPIKFFFLTLASPVTSSSPASISGSYAEPNGCVRTTGILAGGVPGGVQITVPPLACLASGLILNVTSGIGGNFFEGTCNVGASCTFQLARAPL